MVQLDVIRKVLVIYLEIRVAVVHDLVDDPFKTSDVGLGEEVDHRDFRVEGIYVDCFGGLRVSHSNGSGELVHVAGFPVVGW